MHFDFTDEIREVLAHTREAALALGHERVGPEHMLLGILRCEHSRGRAILQSLKVDLSQLEESLVRSMPPGQSRRRQSELPYNSAAKSVLEGTLLAARDSTGRNVDSATLLLGLVRTPSPARCFLLFGSKQSRVSLLLQRAGITAEELQIQVGHPAA